MDNLLKKQKEKLKRAAKLTQILSKYGFEDFKAKLDYNNTPDTSSNDDTLLKKEHDLAFYERIRRAIEELGPTYIKFGQTLSTREDLFPTGLVKELKKLQDNVAVGDWDVVDIIKTDLQIDPDEYFTKIETEPLASASIAQTYKAKLQSGEDVILKIKRPNINRIVQGDLWLMKDIIDLLMNYYPSVREINLAQIFDAFAQNLYEELSFIHELNNIDKFASNFKGESSIVTMKPYPHLCSDNILCISFIKGSKVNDTTFLKENGIDPENVLDKTISLFLTQVLDHGFFHADPHPGNILVTKNGQISFIDLGAMARMIAKDKEYLEDFIIYFLNKDAHRLISTLKKMSLSIEIQNEKSLERSFTQLFEAIDGKSLEDIDIKALFTQFSHILNENNIIMPQHVYLLVKGIVLMEGICRDLVPTANVIEKIKPYITEITKKRFAPENLFENSLTMLWELKRMISMAPKTLSNVVDKVNEGEILIQTTSKEHQQKFQHQLRNNSLNRILAVACTTFIGGCILADLPQLAFAQISIAGWFLFFITFLLLVYILIKRAKIIH